jgi:hypothetical protein
LDRGTSATENTPAEPAWHSPKVLQYAKQRDNLRPANGNVQFTPEMIDAHNQDIKTWARLMGIDLNKINRFTQFERTASYAGDPRMTGLQGKAMGDRIQALEIEKWEKMHGDKSKEKR